MNTVTLNKFGQRLCELIILLCIVFVMESCSSTKQNFLTSSVVPAAEGSVKVKKDGNSNYNIDLSVMRLAEPERLSPAKKMYIVWMDTDEKGRINIGQLNTSSSLLSSTLKSSLRTVTSYKPKGFIITAEDESNIQYPGGQVVLSTGNF